MATRTRGRSGNVLLLAIGLAVVVFCAASTAAVAAKTPPQMTMNDEADNDDSGAAAAKEAGLSVDFHAAGCPNLDSIVRSAVEEARRGDAQAVTAGLLRIFFHDCFPQGCDASLLLDKTQPGSEQNIVPQNKGLQQVALNLVETIRGRVHAICSNTVSCADILALATSHAVKLAGGPFIPMELGRNDSRGPAPQDAVGKLPKPTDSFEALKSSFAGKTLNGIDVVALSGAHTVGMARCSSFKDRIDKPGGAKDNFEWGLTGYCGNDMEKKHNFDDSPSIFDNKYFVALKNGRGLLTSDQTLYRDMGSRWLVEKYAASQDDFFNGFKESMLRLSRLRGSDPGPVRNNCFRPNFRASDTNLVLETTAGAGDDDEDHVLAAAA